MTMLYKGFTFLQILLIIIGITLTVAFGTLIVREIYKKNNHNTVRKISSEGEQIWKFSGHSDMVSSVHVDNQGNVYSRSGWVENETRKLNKDGEEVRKFKDNLITVDQGIIYTKSSDGILQKIDHEGQEVWNIDVGEAKIETVDDQGNVYSMLDNGALQKINNDGKKTWTLKKRGEDINLVDIDSQGNVYIRVDNSIQKINRSGQVVWSFEEDSSKEIESIKVDSQGNMYSHISSVNSDSFNSTIRKITPQGEEEWNFNYPYWYYEKSL